MTRRKAYSDRAKHYHAAIRSILLAEWDPIGVAHIPGPPSSHLWQIETDRMGLCGNRQHTDAIVDRLLRLRDAMEAHD
jgi:hypothetical protein